MRVENIDSLDLKDHNKKYVYQENLETPLESYYHMASNCALYEIDGVKYPLFMEDLSFLKNDAYLMTIHKVTAPEVERLDIISYKYYKTPELWWLIAEVNNIDAFDMYEGQELIIPELRAFDFYSMSKDNFQYKSKGTY